VPALKNFFLDFEDFLRQRGLPLWTKVHPTAQEVRHLAYQRNRTYQTYSSYIEKATSDIAANTIICLIHQANYLLDQQLRQLEKSFLTEGGFTERLYHVRKKRQ
jgi:four helix bundle suffix protein